MPSIPLPLRALAPALACLLLLAGCSPARADEAARIADLLGIGRGDVVADVGAGEGEWTVALAERVGAGGRVFSTEVTDEELEAIGDSVRAAGVDNVEVVRGTQRTTGLPAGCCDAILLRMVYHHFTDPAAMLADLARALTPSGRLLVIDIEPQQHWRDLEGVPERGGHGLAPERLIEELRAGGFAAIDTRRSWNDDSERYAVLFRLDAGPTHDSRPDDG